MFDRNDRREETISTEPGFVLPAVIVALLLLSTMAIAAMITAGDEQRSARAMRESSTAFYAAEAGLHEVYAEWEDDRSALDSLAPGDSLELGWHALGDGSRYRAVVHRWDSGDAPDPIYQLVVTGHGPGAQGPQRTLSLVVAGGGGNPKLGKCCDAPVTVDGTVAIDDDLTGLDGHDEHPSSWDAAGACPDPLEDKPGLIMRDTTQLDIQDEDSYVDGDPRIVQDTSITDEAFDDFGGLSWDSLKAMADHVIDASDGEIALDDGDVYPRHKNGGSECDTSDPYNWGSDDPTDPCFNYFPIILVKGEVETEDIYGQGIIIVDWDDSAPSGQKGGEFELEWNSTFNGIILGKGCVEIQDGTNFHGAVFTDGRYRNEETCGSDMDFDTSDDSGSGAQTTWSSCVVKRVLEGTALKQHTTGSGSWLLDNRSFNEMIY